MFEATRMNKWLDGWMRITWEDTHKPGVASVPYILNILLYQNLFILNKFEYGIEL